MASGAYKEEILDNYWGKIVFQLMTQRELRAKTKDEEGMDMAAKLSNVDAYKPVKYALLHEYVHRCKELYSVAF